MTSIAELPPASPQRRRRELQGHWDLRPMQGRRLRLDRVDEWRGLLEDLRPLDTPACDDVRRLVFKLPTQRQLPALQVLVRLADASAQQQRRDIPAESLADYIALTVDSQPLARALTCLLEDLDAQLVAAHADCAQCSGHAWLICPCCQDWDPGEGYCAACYDTGQARCDGLDPLQDLGAPF